MYEQGQWDKIKRNTANVDSTPLMEEILSGTAKDSENVEDVNTTDSTEPEERLDFKGDWKTTNDTKAFVAFYLLGTWFGTLTLCGEVIPTFWNKHGDSTNDKYNLKRKRRPSEFWD